MRICLVRHGIAIDREDPRCPSDPKRALTGKGLRRTRAAMQGLASLGVAPDAVLSSPYVRAMQTAEVVQDVLNPRIPITSVEALVPAGEPGGMVDGIASALDDRFPERMPEDVVCVGHAPSLDDLLSYLIGAESDVARLKKSGVAMLEVSTLRRGGATVLALLPPQVLRALGGASAASG